MSGVHCRYGAVGTPIWFGLGGLGLSEDNLKTVGFKVSIILAVNAHIIPILAARFLISWGDLRRNWLFILLSIWSALIPAVALSKVSTDFSSLVGGIVSTIAVGILAKFRVRSGSSLCVQNTLKTLVGRTIKQLTNCLKLWSTCKPCPLTIDLQPTPRINCALCSPHACPRRLA